MTDIKTIAADEHCRDCCCARSWAALGITSYTGKSIPEHIAELRTEVARLGALEATGADLYKAFARAQQEIQAALSLIVTQTKIDYRDVTPEEYEILWPLVEAARERIAKEAQPPKARHPFGGINQGPLLHPKEGHRDGDMVYRKGRWRHEPLIATAQRYGEGQS